MYQRLDPCVSNSHNYKINKQREKKSHTQKKERKKGKKENQVRWKWGGVGRGQGIGPSPPSHMIGQTTLPHRASSGPALQNFTSCEIVTSCERPCPQPPFYDVRPNPREWMESCYYFSKWRFG